jgi:1-acyl-sn-glycerol-3-phosphate acyltransferase
MKRKVNPFIFLYQWLIFVPLFAIATVLTAVSILVFSYLFGEKTITYLPGRHWSKLACIGMFMKVKVIGAEKIIPKKSYIFAANHQSGYDIFLAYGWLPARFKWIMKQELRKVPFVGAACDISGHIFIDRTSPISAKKSIEAAIKKLSNGTSVFVYPEGTRSKTGKLGKFKRGAFTLASEIRFPIVPLTLKGTYEAMPIWSYNIHPCTLTLVIHDPIPYQPEFDENPHLLMDKVREVIESAL